MYISLRLKYSLFMSGLIGTNFLDRYTKNTEMYNVMKIRPVEGTLFHDDGRMDRRTHMTKIVIAFCKFFERA
jgi:hypothetical protein